MYKNITWTKSNDTVPNDPIPLKICNGLGTTLFCTFLSSPPKKKQFPQICSTGASLALCSPSNCSLKWEQRINSRRFRCKELLHASAQAAKYKALSWRVVATWRAESEILRRGYASSQEGYFQVWTPKWCSPKIEKKYTNLCFLVCFFVLSFFHVTR